MNTTQMNDTRDQCQKLLIIYQKKYHYQDEYSIISMDYEPEINLGQRNEYTKRCRDYYNDRENPIY